jgi:[ribosomal protein S18]-alanine N-acetyltransferase
MSVEFRHLARTDLGALAKVHATCFPTEAWSVRDFMELLAIRGAGGRLAIAGDGGIAGFVVDLVGEIDAEILTLGVAPQARRQGIARALIDDLCRRARQKGARRVLLEVASDNEAAIGLYESCGFKLLGERPDYYRRPGGKMDGYILGLTLASAEDRA